MSPRSLSPAARSWLRFKRNRRGFVSLWIFVVLVLVSLAAEVLSNDKPMLASYDGKLYTPLFKDYPETTFGGDFRRRPIISIRSSSSNWPSRATGRSTR